MATDIGFEELLAYLERRRGFDFTGCTRPGLARRIGKRMQAVAAAGYPEYLTLLESNPHAIYATDLDEDAPARGRTARDTTRQLRSEVLLARSKLFTPVEPRHRIVAKAAGGTSEPSA
jgi:hypothetical protein